MSLSIEEYGFIGDCETGALVGRDGSIDWLCWPRFDSGACFAALLGNTQNGRWLLAPAGKCTVVRRSYQEDSLVLNTYFETQSGSITVTDFMPQRGENSDLIRIVRCDTGSVEVCMELILRFDYGRTIPWVTRLADGGLRAIAGPHMIHLHSDVKTEGRDNSTVSRFTLQTGESRSMVMTYSPSHLPPPAPVPAEQALEETLNQWRTWTARSSAEGPYKELIDRSSIILKALTYRPTGGIVAAATTSLPERIGGERNWDYRFCWLRDATLTLLALMNCGHIEEAAAWRSWLLRAAAGNPAQVQIMYGVAGERDLQEWQLPWLSGYKASIPVRSGNAASTQLQLDVYGEVCDALHQARIKGLELDEEAWQLERALINHLQTIWREKDAGMWEIRGPVRHFTHSKLMAWVAFDRGIKAIEQFGLRGPLQEWREVRDCIHSEICTLAWNEQLQSFTQAYETKSLDAGLLMMPLVGFLPVEDDRMRSTVDAIEKHLCHDGLVARYNTGEADDGLSGGEGAFLACSLWLADNFALQGNLSKAKAIFDRVIALQNDLGLLAEEYDPVNKCMLGNFPQAFSHVAIINTALNLSRAVGPAEQRKRA